MGGKSGSFASHLVTAIINVVISVPGLYGYTAVIFHHDVYSPYMNALPKLVILSSAIHQLGFTIFSSLPFAIGTVQDAGLIFLAAMSTLLADEILGGGGTAEEVVSTALVILPLGMAALGLVLVRLRLLAQRLVPSQPPVWFQAQPSSQPPVRRSRPDDRPHSQ